MSRLFEQYQALKKGEFDETATPNKAQTRFGLLEVRKDGASFREKGVSFTNQELSLVMDKGLSRQMIDGIFKLKEVFEGEVVECKGGDKA
ncbi:MAG: hypothetical protein ACE5KK_04175 [Candidatus Brocadiales bacterium]